MSPIEEISLTLTGFAQIKFRPAAGTGTWDFFQVRKEYFNQQHRMIPNAFKAQAFQPYLSLCSGDSQSGYPQSMTERPATEKFNKIDLIIYCDCRGILLSQRSGRARRGGREIIVGLEGAVSGFDAGFTFEDEPGDVAVPGFPRTDCS